MGIRGRNCEILRHQTTINFQQEAGNQDITYFFDDTTNHYKALVNVRITTAVISEGFKLEVVVIDRNGEEDVEVPIFPEAVGGLMGQVVVQVEDAKSISIRKTDGAGVNGSIEIIKDFCICCS